MTERERIIVSAYTGFLMCDFNDLHKYIEEKMQRPVFIHELASEKFMEELREKIKDDFVGLCKEKENDNG